MKLRPFIQLMRLDKPIGIWLVYFPAAWSVALTASAHSMWRLQALMLLGAALTRAAGCIMNDLADRKLDAQVARTHTRPLASGALSKRQALAALAALLFAALALALSLPPAVFTLSLLAVPMIAAYPWMKRFTWWPQAFLGITFNLGALIGWAATGTPLSAPALLIYAAAAAWTLGYDTIYAVQDMADDRTVGIKSSAQAVGRHLRPFIAACYGLMLALLAAAGMLHHTAPVYYAALIAAALHALWQVRQMPPSPAQAGVIFRSNQWLGFYILAGCLLSRAG